MVKNTHTHSTCASLIIPNKILGTKCRCNLFGWKRSFEAIKYSFFYLYGKRSTATAGFAGIGVIEREATGVQSVFPVNLHTHQVNAMHFIHDKGLSFSFKFNIVGLLVIETQYIRKARTSA